MTVALIYPQSDLALSRRLETAEGRGSVAFVESRAQMTPESGARWIEVAGAYAMYDGETSPITQTFRLGLVRPPTAADLDTLESFFHERGAPVNHEVTPLADVGRVNARRMDVVSFIVELDGQPIAAGALSLFEGVALLAGASTIPDARRQGAQLALLEARLRYAAGEGYELAMICAQPGSASQRNAE